VWGWYLLYWSSELTTRAAGIARPDARTYLVLLAIWVLLDSRAICTVQPKSRDRIKQDWESSSHHGKYTHSTLCIFGLWNRPLNFYFVLPPNSSNRLHPAGPTLRRFQARSTSLTLISKKCLDDNASFNKHIRKYLTTSLTKYSNKTEVVVYCLNSERKNVLA
jgi:hypothetical protein